MARNDGRPQDAIVAAAERSAIMDGESQRGACEAPQRARAEKRARRVDARSRQATAREFARACGL